jgi:hypothetical protein
VGRQWSAWRRRDDDVPVTGRSGHRFVQGLTVGLAVFVTGFVVSLILLDYPEEGPVVAVFSRSHGLHQGDLVLMAAWAGVMCLLLLPWRSLGRRVRAGSRRVSDREARRGE